MKNLFAEMDLYKGIILFSFLAIPAACYFAYSSQKNLETAQKAVRDATKRGGILENIGEYSNRLHTIQNAQRNNGGDQYRLFFERQILASAKDGIKRQDFTISNEQVRKVAKLRAEDREVSISFRRNNKDEFPLPRSYINQVLLRSEAQSRGVWKLRQLKIRNKEVLETSRGKKAPPRTVADEWVVDRMVFARRQPERR